MTTDHKAMGRQIDRLLSRLKRVREARITTALGTDIRFTFHDRPWFGEKRRCAQAGRSYQPPGSEVFLAPFDASGRVVIDGELLEMAEYLRELSDIPVV